MSDLRFAVRQLLKNPGFTAVAVITLALGIGANTAIFSLVDTVLLKPLPFREPERLALVWEDGTQMGLAHNTPSPANYAAWKAENRVFEDMAAMEWRSFSLSAEGEPEKVESQGVTANFLPLLGVAPERGRFFTPEEDQPGANRVALLSHGLWQRRFGGDPSVVGKEISLDGQLHVVIGVMPAGFQFLSRETGLWVPKAFSAAGLANRDAHYLTVLARLRPGVSLDQAHADLAAISQRIHREFPTPGGELGSAVVPLREQLVGDVRPTMVLLLVAVGFVLLIACANLANLLLARGAVRVREMAVRAALGAGRGRMVRQLMTESTLLAVAGALLGVALAWLSLSFLRQMVPGSLAMTNGVRLDARVFGFTLLLALVTSVVFGLVPAFEAVRVDLNEALKRSGGRSGTGARSGRLRGVLVVVQVALALILLVGAGLLSQSLLRLRTLDLGVNAENVLIFRTELPEGKYAATERRAAFYQQVLQQVRALPGVAAAGYTTAAPLTLKGGTSDFSVEGRAPAPGQDANNRQVSPGYLEAMGFRLRQGRLFDEHDGPQALPVAILNETMARQCWPGEDAVGKRFKLGSAGSTAPWVTVVGVVVDVKEMGLAAPAKAGMFFPGGQMAHMQWNLPRDLVVRTQSDPRGIVNAVRQAVWAVDPTQPVSSVRTMNDIVAGEVTQRRVGTTLLAAFALLALTLASVGLYGVLACLVAQRTKELGLRTALGAQRIQLIGLVLRQGMKLTGIGIAVGIVGALAATQLLRGLLFGVTTTDPLTFFVVPLVLLAVALLACWLPARRAARVDPVVALRSEG